MIQLEADAYLLQGNLPMQDTSEKVLFFYQGDRLTTVKQGALSHTVLRSSNQPLAELHNEGGPNVASIFATDEKGSVLCVDGDQESEPR